MECSRDGIPRETRGNFESKETSRWRHFVFEGSVHRSCACVQRHRMSLQTAVGSLHRLTMEAVAGDLNGKFDERSVTFRRRLDVVQTQFTLAVVTLRASRVLQCFETRPR
jgi:hypothetical protein